MTPPVGSPPPVAFVGGAACGACHEEELRSWRTSQHARAMARVSDATVLGDFADASFTSGAVTSTFFRRDGGFFVRTDGPDSGLDDFAISWTFGVEPLQQYLVDFPDGRKQALGLAWDARAPDAGGQRWFQLYPGGRVAAGDRLHWTAIDQNWNYQCADCHSTNVRKGFDAQNNAFATTWTDDSVSCEACHGPGSSHLTWARAAPEDRARNATRGLTASLDERRGVTWTRPPGARHASRSRPRESSRELDVCARCHARRAQLTDAHVAGQPFLDAFRPALLEPGLYFADGQQRDEVYTWGSFLQSKMYARGVTCSDCHDPHSGKLRAAGSGVCAQCHDAKAFDAPEHHHHAQGSPGAACAGCHLPPRTYMVNDPRHDHSFRIPRPELSVRLGVPNACTSCHAAQSPDWAAQEVARWFPRRAPGFQDFAQAFSGVEKGDPAALVALRELAADPEEPAFVRASALGRLARHPSAATTAALRRGLEDRDPLVRTAAVAGLGQRDPTPFLAELSPLLADPSRLVRVEAARALSGTTLTGPAIDRARQELLDELRFQSDRPEAHFTLATLATTRADPATARAELEKALAIDPSMVEASVNLADLHRAQGEEARAEQVLRRALLRDPSAAAAHHALGLALVRQRRLPEALEALSRASTLAPDDPRFAWVYAVALHDTGRAGDALRVVDGALAHHPFDPELLFAAAQWRAESGDGAAALTFAGRLEAVAADDPRTRALLQQLGAH
ncbi:MAG: tetratricopeptide repeat protein [Myxococcales bacterium]|nr:tetratricopeptide repeat protein [Myxococcales bacterium]